MPVASRGAPLESARAAMIMVHGRGASAEDMLSLSGEFFDPAIAYLAPQAAGNTWYPHSFLAAIASNEPGISSGIAVIRALEDRAARAGIPSNRLFLLGFSQGACLTLEYAARNARRFGGIAGLERRVDRARGNPAGVRGVVRGYTGVPGVQLIRPAYPRAEGAAHGEGLQLPSGQR